MFEFGIFLVVFSHIRAEYEDLLYKSPYSVRIQEKAEQKKLRIGARVTKSPSGVELYLKLNFYI